MAAMSDSDFEPITPAQRPSKSPKGQLTKVLAKMKHTKSDFMQKMLGQGAPDSVKLLLKSKGSGGGVALKAAPVQAKPVFQTKQTFDDDVSSSSGSSGSDSDSSNEPSGGNKAVKVTLNGNQKLISKPVDDSKQKKPSPNKNTKRSNSQSSSDSSGDSSSDEETHNVIIHKKTPILSGTITKSVPVQKKSSSSDSSEDEKTITHPPQTVRNVVQPSKSSSSESGSSSSEDETKVAPPSKIVNHNQISSSEDDGSSTDEEETTITRPSQLKISSDEEQTTINRPQPVQQQPPKSTVNHPQKVQHTVTKSIINHPQMVQNKQIKPTNNDTGSSDSGSSSSDEGSSSSDEEKSRVKVQTLTKNVSNSSSDSDSSGDEKKTPQRVIKTSKSDSSSSDSCSSNDENNSNKVPNRNTHTNTVNPVQINNKNSPHKTIDQTMSTPLHKSKKLPDSGHKNVSKNISGRSISSIDSDCSDQIELSAREPSRTENDSKELIKKYAKKWKLDYVKPLDILDVHKDISGDDEVFLMKISKNLDPNLLMKTKFSLDKPKLITVGEDHFKLAVDQSDKNSICLVGQSDGKYAMRRVETVGCITINQEHILQKFEPIVPTINRSKVPFPTDQLRERHPLFGPDYKTKITLDEEITRKLDGLIDSLQKKIKKKHKSKSSAEDTPKKEKSKNQEKSRKRKHSVADDTDSGVNVSSEPVVKKKPVEEDISSVLSSLFPTPGKLSVKKGKKNKSSDQVLNEMDDQSIKQVDALNQNKSGGKNKDNLNKTPLQLDASSTSKTTPKKSSKKKNNVSVDQTPMEIVALSTSKTTPKKSKHVSVAQTPTKPDALSTSKTTPKKNKKVKNLDHDNKETNVGVKALEVRKSETGKNKSSEDNLMELSKETIASSNSSLKKSKKKRKSKTSDEMNEIPPKPKEKNSEESVVNNKDSKVKTNIQDINDIFMEFKEKTLDEIVVKKKKSKKEKKDKNKSNTLKDDSPQTSKSKINILEQITFPAELSVKKKKRKSIDVPQMENSLPKKISPQFKLLSSVANSTMMSPSINKTLFEPDESQILPMDQSVRHKKRRKSTCMDPDFLEKLMETVQESESPKKKKKRHSK